MKVLFLKLPDPPNKSLCRDFMGGFGVAYQSVPRELFVVPPVFSAYSAAMLEKRGFEPAIIDGQVSYTSPSQLLQEIERRNPEVIVSRISLPSFKNDLEILSKIESLLPNAFLIGWGAICKVRPEKTLNTGVLDLIIREEMEFTLLEVMERLRNGEDLHSVEGISFKSEDKTIHNPIRPFVKNLDILPFAAYHLLDMDKYVLIKPKTSVFFPEPQEIDSVRYFCLYSSRGCSFNCVYCGHPIVFGPWRGMTAKRIVDEVEHLVDRHRIQAIRFLDQSFTMDVKRAMQICQEIVDRDLNIRWVCEARADRLPRELVKTMREAGCVRIEMGVETGDPDLLTKMGKRGMTLGKIEEAFRITKEEGMLRDAYVLVGLPGESWETVKRTRDLINKINPDFLCVSIVTPFPGTPLYEMAEKNGWLISKNWNDYTTMEPVMNLPEFTSADMRRAWLYLLDQKGFTKDFQEITRLIRERKLTILTRKLINNIPVVIKRIYNYLFCKIKLILHKV